MRDSPDLVLDSWRLHPRGADHGGLGSVLGDPRTSPTPIPASPPARHPPPRRCGWRAPRLTLQLGRRLAIGLKIAAPARSPARPGKGRISPAGAEPLAERISSPHGCSSRVPLFRCAALLLRPAALSGHAAPGRPVQRAERRQEDGCRGPGRAAGTAHAHDPRAQVGGPCLQERVRLLLRLPGKEDP